MMLKRDPLTLDLHDRSPSHLGGVRIQSVLGEGGMGRVYLGHHEALDMAVAVKVMRDPDGDVDRFLAEARLAARIRHDHMVQIHHAGQEGGQLFLVMEYVSGSNLKQMVKDSGRLPWREAAGYILQAARGLAVVHRAGIIHRDVKPSNMLVTKEGHLKVADLGVARDVAGNSLGTSAGSPIGTPAYMAPEQIRDARQAGPAADVYALGISLYHLLAGEVPFRANGFSNVLLAHLNDPVPDIRKQVADLPPKLVELLNRMLSKNPELRPMDGTAVVMELERVLGLTTLSTETASRPNPPRNRFAWWRPAAALALMGGTTMVLVPSANALSPTVTHAVQQVAPPANPAVAPAVPVDAWQSPPRAVFVLADHLPVTALQALDDACRASGLPVIERQRVDVLVGEQTMATHGQIDPATAGRIGRLIGGHIAIFATPVEERIEVRTVLVETGEVIASRLVAPADAGSAAKVGVEAAIGTLTLQGRVRADHDRTLVSLGTRHGLRLGDHVELHRDRADSPVVTTAVVTTVERDQAQIVCDQPKADSQGALAIVVKP